MNPKQNAPRARRGGEHRLQRGYKADLSTRGQFNRALLPDPAAYYSRELQGIRPRTGSPWVLTRCCFHEDTHPSLSVNLQTGGFRCFACGEHGGDVLDFHQLRYGMTFKAAAQDLGAWEITHD